MAPKKKAVKPKAKKKIKAKVPAKWKGFSDWWDKVAYKKVSKIEGRWLKENKPNDSDEDEGGDHWYVNRMMYDGEAHEMTAEIAEEVFEMGRKGEAWEMNQGSSLYCELDSVIMDAYEAGRKCRL